MKRKKSVIRQLLDNGGLEEECVPGQAVVELLGDSRILVENHRRIIEYDLQRISIRVNYGMVCIQGCNLQLRQMTGRKLLITGTIHQIDLFRGNNP